MSKQWWDFSCKGCELQSMKLYWAGLCCEGAAPGSGLQLKNDSAVIQSIWCVSGWTHNEGDWKFCSTTLKKTDPALAFESNTALCVPPRPVRSIIKIAELPFKHLLRHYLKFCWPAFLSHLPEPQPPWRVRTSRENPNPRASIGI